MLKKINIIHLILLILDLLIIPIVGFIFGFDSPNTFISVLCTVLMGHPLIYLLMMLIKEAKILDYDTPRFMPLCMVLTILLGCLIWYCFFHLNFVYAQTITIWYACVLLAFSIPVIIVKILEKVSKNKKSNGPRFIKK